MSVWLSNQSVGFALVVATSLRAVQQGASSLASPAMRRRAQSGVTKLVTLVAGH